MIPYRTQDRCPAKAHRYQLVNSEALLTNWEIGQYISMQLRSSVWGARVVSDLADYLKRQNPK